jgi:hypothetical protein
LAFHFGREAVCHAPSKAGFVNGERNDPAADHMRIDAAAGRFDFRELRHASKATG